jgi:hypothetical protein
LVAYRNMRSTCFAISRHCRAKSSNCSLISASRATATRLSHSTAFVRYWSALEITARLAIVRTSIAGQNGLVQRGQSTNQEGTLVFQRDGKGQSALYIGTNRQSGTIAEHRELLNANVRFGSLAAAPAVRSRVRFPPNSGHELRRSSRPLWARSGHVTPLRFLLSDCL